MASKPVSFLALPMNQPIGEFFVGVIDFQDLVRISYADIRDLRRDLDEFVGIQRVLSEERVKQIRKFVGTSDATFPTSIVLSVPGECFEYIETERRVILRPASGVPEDQIAKILDGQHRIAGLKGSGRDVFEVPVTLIVEADIADQAYIFATVNLAQTKVNRSLVYDLLDYSESRSPQKTAHEIAVGLDKYAKSPFFKIIKRLGRATPGRVNETLSQAVFVNALLPLISSDPVTDRDLLKRGKKLRRATSDELKRTPLRNLFIDGEDGKIAKLILHYFREVQLRWPEAWESRETGQMLPRTNGFRAFMRFFKDVYLNLTKENKDPNGFTPTGVKGVLAEIDLTDKDFNTDNFPPGSAGETKLYKVLTNRSSSP